MRHTQTACTYSHMQRQTSTLTYAKSQEKETHVMLLLNTDIAGRRMCCRRAVLILINH